MLETLNIRVVAAPVERGGYRALKTWLPHTERSARMLTRVPGTVPFDVSSEFVRVVDQVMAAKGRGLTWDHLSKADNGRATPLARYEPGRALLGELIEEAREADSVPYGLWLLCPMRGPQGPATLDGRPAGVIADAEQALLPRGFTAPEAVPVG